ASLKLDSLNTGPLDSDQKPASTFARSCYATTFSAGRNFEGIAPYLPWYKDRSLNTLFPIHRVSNYSSALNVAVCLAYMPLVFAESTVSDPDRIVNEVTLAVTERLANSAERLKANPGYVKTIVADLVVPHFDFPSLAAEALQRYWDELSTGERRCASDGFRQRLVEHYAHFLLDYEYTSIVTHRPTDIPQSVYVYVTQTAMSPHPQPLAIKYKMRFINGAWKVFDLIVADVSLVMSYRTSFADEITALGIGDFLRTFPECKER
ncbi:MAG: phospholipid transport system substrate-binding protein, partial [Gammaproteobacteria bacterium]